MLDPKYKDWWWCLRLAPDSLVADLRVDYALAVLVVAGGALKPAIGSGYYVEACYHSTALAVPGKGVALWLAPCGHSALPRLTLAQLKAGEYDLV